MIARHGCCQSAIADRALAYLPPGSWGAAWRSHRKGARAAGFTLLELMVVVVIIGLLAALVVPRYFNTVGKSKITIARAQMDSLDKALEEYRLDVGSLPTVGQGLRALVVQPAGVKKWQGPYLKKGVPMDPWGNAYIYKPGDGGHDVEIISYGSDGQPGGSGDAKDIYLSGSD